MRFFSILSVFSISFLYASSVTLNSGWNLVGISGTSIQSIGTVLTSKSEVTEILDFTGAGYRSYDNTLPEQFKTNQPFQSLLPGKGYWINANASVSIDLDISSGIVNNSKILIDQIGWSQLAFNENMNISTTLTNMDYVEISEILDFTGDGYRSYDNTLPEQFKANQPLQTFTNNTGYWVKVTSIDYDKYLQNAITADPDLTSYLNQNLSDKSIVVMENNSGALKTSLITFSSVTGSTYREVELTNFSVSTLNSSDADINATISDSVANLETAICGTWNVDTTTLNMTPDNGGGLVMIADSSEGNFTMASTFKKVVYYGEAINLDHISNCQTNSFSPPAVPGGIN